MSFIYDVFIPVVTATFIVWLLSAALDMVTTQHVQCGDGYKELCHEPCSVADNMIDGIMRGQYCTCVPVECNFGDTPHSLDCGDHTEWL